ncbi:hypothetical protein [Streptococcus jiangjianxini]|uniref:hypothetical protein n=1 Tax=Streptococcus jiangjianxini TaxID=3161189 RepID=UPI0032EDC077
MKTIVKLGLSLSCLLLLAACQTNTTSHTSESSVNSSTKKSNKSEAAKQSSENSQSSKKSMKNPQTSKAQASESPTSPSEKHDQKYYEALYADTLSKVAADDNNVSHYAFYDIDHNGSKELFTGTDVGSTIHPIALYYLKNHVSTYLAHSEVASGGDYRSGFEVNADGTVTHVEWTSHQGKGSLKKMRLNPDNSGVTIIEEKAIVISSAEEKASMDDNSLDLSSLDWKKLDKVATTSSETKTTEPNPKRYTFDNLVGTWKNAKGDKVTISSDKTVDLNGSQGQAGDLSNTNNRWGTGVQPSGSRIGGYGIRYLPAKEAASDQDQSDKSKERLLIGQYDNSGNTDDYFYRVE